MARAALAGGAQRLAVALVDEGVELRQHGVDRAGPAAERVRRRRRRHRARLRAHARRCTRRRGSRPSPTPPGPPGRQTAVHLKVDTGMHRVGARPRTCRRWSRPSQPSRPCSSRACGPTCRSPTARRTRTAPTREGQLDLFDGLVAGTGRRGYHRCPCCTPPTRRAPSRSPLAPRHGALRHRPLRLPARRRRAGAPSTRRRRARARCARPCRSRPAWWRCATLPAGERPSYGRLRPLPARSLVATVPIGYADGVPRALFDAGYEVLIGGVRRPLAGMVTMDQIVVDCGDDASVRPGDEVVLLGRQGTEDDHGGRLGGHARDDQLRGGVRRGPAHAAGPREPPRRARCLTPTSLERLRLTASTCTLCPLAKGRTQVVFGVGNAAADLLFVGEGPGREEDLAGEPFVGRSGKLLDRLMCGGDRPHPGRVLHRQRGQVPATQQPRPGAERDRGLPALSRRADRPSSTRRSS